MLYAVYDFCLVLGQALVDFGGWSRIRLRGGRRGRRGRLRLHGCYGGSRVRRLDRRDPEGVAQAMGALCEDLDGYAALLVLDGIEVAIRGVQRPLVPPRGGGLEEACAGGRGRQVMMAVGGAGAAVRVKTLSAPCGAGDGGH